MKNLAIETQATCLFEDNETLNQSYHATYDAENEIFYLVEPDEKKLIAISAQDNRIILNDFIEIKNDLARPMGLVYMGLDQEVYIAYDAGFVMQVKQVSSNQMRYFEMTVFDHGIFSISISPDHEISVVVTREYEVITLDRMFDVLKKTSLKNKEFGEKQFITVGWGKKETQFHGSEGKSSRKAATVEGRTELDDCMPRTTWKGDGTMFAVSYIDLESQARRFKVFSREGVLQYTSELKEGLEACLSWKPSGNLIAATRKLPNKHNVALFECNGLLHREFTFPFGVQEMLIMDLIWSRDSDILAVLHKDISSNITSIHLWSEKNYHWYLKQTIFYPPDNPIIFATWSPNVGKDLLVLSAKSTTTYKFYWKIDCSQGLTSQDNAVVGVIDGSKVLVTGFRNGIVPPPMAEQTLQFAGPVNAICFAPSHRSNDTNEFLVLLSNNKMLHCKSKNEEGKWNYAVLKTYNISFQIKNLSKYSFNLINHMYWYKPNVVFCSLSTGLKSSLCALELLKIEHLDQILIDAMIIHEMPGQINRIFSSPSSDDAYIICNNKLFNYNDVSGLEKTSLYIGDETPFKIEFVKFGNKEVVVNLSRKNVLYVGGKQVANHVTSYHVHSEFFLVTTLQHTLIAFQLNDEGLSQLENKDLTVQPWVTASNEAQKEQELNIRRVERGSTIVTVIPKDSMVILQMPRGNLECIQPRALSIAIIGNLLDSLDYKPAFDLMRKQRIDLNLLYDHAPTTFMANAEKFVNDIKKSSWLSLFLSDLTAEDVTKTMYKSCYAGRQSEIRVCKVQEVCEKLRTIMEKDHDNFLQPILISLVKDQKRAGLEAALKKVKELMILEEEKIDEKMPEVHDSKAPHHDPKDRIIMDSGVPQLADSEITNEWGRRVDLDKMMDDEEGEPLSVDNDTIRTQVSPTYEETSLADDALKYLLYMVNVNVLYDVALGMYDFRLVMLIADKAQKDPKEYLSFLNELLQLDEEHRKFAIDNHLKRYSSALDHISKLPEKMEDCLSFIKSHNLYAKALKIFADKPEEYKKIAVAYAEYLSEKSQYREAGIMFTKGGKFSKALEVFKLANSWQDAIVTAMKLDMNYQQLSQLYEDLVVRLAEEKRHREAATILSKYLNRIEDAIAMLCEGRHWHDAWIEACCIKREDLLETHVKPGLIEHSDFTLSQLRKNHADFLKYKLRLATVREQLAIKALAQMNFAEEDDTGNNQLSDLLSDTTSIAGSTVSKSSRSSGRSYRSSKNRRKHERKLQSVKEGSAYEDLALIRMLHSIVSQTYASREEVRCLGEMLLYINRDKLAEDLCKEMKEFLASINKSKREIWPPTIENATNNNENSEQTSPTLNLPNLTLEPYLMRPPEEKPCNWKLDIFSES